MADTKITEGRKRLPKELLYKIKIKSANANFIFS
jgi:hypothetical protein